MKGININDRTQDFTGQILRKEKVIETRNSPSLKPYVGKRVGLVRTGKGDATLVGYATVGEPVVYNSLSQFRKDFSRHKVKKGSEFDFKCQKYGYPMIDVEPTTNRKIVSRGIVARQINPVMRKTPKKTVLAYKLFRVKKREPDKLFPLFIGKREAIPMGQWVAAKYLPTKGFAKRAGWHSGILPNAPHLMRRDGTLASDRVWAEIEVPADVDWQSRADASRTGDIKREVPVGGYYRFKRAGLQGGTWIISGAIRVNRVLSRTEVDQIMRDAGASKKSPVGTVTKNPAMRSKLSKIIEPEDRILNYDTGSGEDFYRLWDLIYTASHLNEDALQELEGMLDDNGVLVIETGEEPDNLLKHFKRKTKYQGMLLVQGPISPEKARINTEKLRNE